MKALALALALIAAPVMAIEPPDDVQPRVVQIQLYCVPTMSRMAEIISDTWGESGVVVTQNPPPHEFVEWSGSDPQPTQAELQTAWAEIEADPDYQAHLADPTVGYPKSE